MMGCNLCRLKLVPQNAGNEENVCLGEAQQQQQRNPSIKQYSWDKKKEHRNPKDFILENKEDESIIRKPGTIDGEQLIIQNCKDCEIYILDHANTVTIEDCSDCKIILGPVKGSVFVRSCKDLNCMIVCQQFRMRDCQNVAIFLCTATQPICESSTKVKFGCYRFAYRDLEDQFRKAGLNTFTNNWNDVCDFTPIENGQNWSLFGKDVKIEDYFHLASMDDSNLSAEFSHNVVPYTYGLKEKTSAESTFVILFSDGHTHRRALSFIHEIETKHPEVKLIRTKEAKLTVDDINRVLKSSSYNLVVERGAVIGMEYNGNGCIEITQKTAMSIATSTGSTGLLYVSSNAKSAAVQLKEFFGS